MSDNSSERLKFWNRRAEEGAKAGTDDFVLTGIEQAFILDRVPEGAHVVDLGCGNGGTLIHLAKEKGCHGLGLDFSDGMVKAAQESISEQGFSDHIEIRQGALPPVPDDLGIFDVALTQRSLINIETTEGQRQAVRGIQTLLKPGGFYIMIEATLDGLEETNALRRSLDLEAIDPPWHNNFFSLADVESWSDDNFSIEEFHHISSTYHFLSRVVYAKLAADKEEELRYDSPINLLAQKLPQEIGAFGPVKAWIWRKHA